MGRPACFRCYNLPAMKCARGALGAAFVALLGAAAEEVAYEPLMRFEWKERFVPANGPAQERTESCLGADRLPFAGADSFSRQMPPPGFRETAKEAQIEWQGRRLPGQEVRWIRDPAAEYPNHDVAEFRIWRSGQLPTPFFMIPMGGGPDLPVPAGCARLEVEPVRAGTPGAHESEAERTFSVEGSCGRAVRTQIGDRAYEGFEFSYSVRRGEEGTRATLVISRDMPGGVCSADVVLEGGRHTGSAEIRFVRAEEAPAPAGLKAFPEAGFGFGPPAGYEEQAEKGNGEVVRYRNSAGRVIAIRQVDLGPGGLEGYRRGFRDRAARDANLSVSGSGFWNHVAGRESFSYDLTDRNVGFVATERGGKGYEVRIDGMPEMRPDEVPAILAGWRWIRAAK